MCKHTNSKSTLTCWYKWYKSTNQNPTESMLAVEWAKFAGETESQISSCTFYHFNMKGLISLQTQHHQPSWRDPLGRQTHIHKHTSIKHTCYPCPSCHLWGGSSGLSPRGVKHNIKHCSRANVHYKHSALFQIPDILQLCIWWTAQREAMLTFSMDFLLLTE